MEDRKYIPVTWGDVGRFFLVVALFASSVLNSFVLFQAWKLLGKDFGQLAICWVLIGEYFLISGLAICLTALLKKGFKNLKPVKEKGLIFWLIVGFIVGFLAGLIFWLIDVTGFIFGFIIGPICGFIPGLISGLLKEFS